MNASVPHVSADLREAVDRFRNYRSNPVALATADLLEAIADDMESAGAPNQGGQRPDWTCASILARTILGMTS